jgi:hypothetical protein
LRKQYFRQTGLALSLDYLFYCPDFRVRDPLAAGISSDRIVDAGEAHRLPGRLTSLIGPGHDSAEGRRVHRFYEQLFHLVPDVHAHIRAGERAMARLAGGLAETLGSIEMGPCASASEGQRMW